MATCAALAPKRALHLVQELLILCLEQNQQKPGRWLAQHLMRELDLDGPELGERLLESSQEAGKLVLSMFGAGELAEYVEEPLLTMEIDMEPIDEGPTPFARLPVPSPSTFIRIGCALASAMSEIHEKGKLVHPTSMTLELMMDGVVRITGPGIVIECPKPLNEAPSKKTDIYAAAVLLIEVFLGRSWPRNVPAYKVLPYLRGVLKDLPPSALAPLDSALHPDPKQRPADAEAWLQHWTLCASTESRRATSAGLSDALIDTGYDTHVGFNKILYTQTNQDAVFAATKRHLGLLTVCDGISTANAGSGDVASGITSHVVASLWEQATGRLEEAGDQERQDFIIRALRMANRAVCEAALRFAGGQMEGRIPMGTTAVVAATHGNRISLGWLGDSRAYIIGPYGAALLTADMNQAYERLDAWVRGSEVDWDPTGYALVGYIGHFNEWLRSEALPPKQFHFNLLPGESIVLCTDGITDYIGDTHPESATRLFHRVVNHNPLDAARRLVTLANEGGGGDNATAVIATLDSPWQTDDE